MSFLNLWALWIAAAVVPALLILYFLKLRRREQLVSSTLLWKRAVHDLQVNAPFQKLRKNLLLFLQLLILALAILALARPIVQSEMAQEGRLVILIDRSASMNAREGNETRLDQAKEQAVRLAKTLNRRTGSWKSFLWLAGAEARTQAMVIAFADRATIVSPFTTNTSDLEDLIRGIEPTDGRTNLAEALELAKAYLAPPTMLTPGMESTPTSSEIPSKLVLISDGRVADLDKLVLKGGTMEWIPIGETRDNVGVTALRTQRNYERPELLSVFLTARNFGPTAVSTDVSLYIDGVLTTVKPLTLGAKSETAASQPTTAPTTAPAENEPNSMSLSFDLPLDKAAVLEARVSRDDALAGDNSAFAVIPPPRKLRVLTVTEKNRLLDGVLAGLPLRERPFITPEQWEANGGNQYVNEGQSTFDVVIFDKYQPKRLPNGNFLFLGAVPTQLTEAKPAPVFKVTGAVQNHPLIWWDETHPVLRHVSLEYVYVGESQTIEVPREAEVLIEGPKGPVLVRYAHEGRNYMVLTFPIENSTWWSKQSFPIFVYNIVRYLGGGAAEAERGPVRPGETLRIPLPAGVERGTLIRPDATRVTVTADASGVGYYGGTDRVGIYRVEEGVPDRDRFAVNLEDDWESDIGPPPPTGLKIENQVIAQRGAIKTSTPEVWRWFIGAALLVMFLEWWIYNRRVML